MREVLSPEDLSCKLEEQGSARGIDFKSIQETIARNLCFVPRTPSDFSKSAQTSDFSCNVSSSISISQFGSKTIGSASERP